MIEIDGSRYSGSGTIVRQAVAFAALTGEPTRIVNVRARRPKPGLRPQHVRVVESIRELVDGEAEGVEVGSTEVRFRPGPLQQNAHYRWDIGSAGSTVLLAMAILPVLAPAPQRVQVELQGGIFQDFAPTFFHFDRVLLPLLRRMGIEAEAEMVRPGYVPKGGGILRVSAGGARNALRPVVGDAAGPVERVYGIAFASHLEGRGVTRRMAAAAQEVLRRAQRSAVIEERNDRTAPQPGAALALFASLEGGWTLGADCAGAPRRSSEEIGRRVARTLLEDLGAGAVLDRFAADQVIPFAALTGGESRFLIPRVTEHIESNAWLAGLFLGAEVETRGRLLVVRGVGGRFGYQSTTEPSSGS